MDYFRPQTKHRVQMEREQELNQHFMRTTVEKEQSEQPPTQQETIRGTVNLSCRMKTSS